MSTCEIPEEICNRFKNIIYDTELPTEFTKMVQQYRDCSNAKSFYGVLLQLLILDNWGFNTPETLLEKIKIVLEAGADVNINTDEYLNDCDSTMQWHDDEKNMPIHLACFCATDRNIKYINKELIDLLLSYGADINSRNNKNYTPIMFIGIFYKDIVFFKYLVEKGADINALTIYNRNIVHKLAQTTYYIDCNNSFEYEEEKIYNKMKPAFDFCLEHNIDINALDENEANALEYAFLNENFAMIKLLIENGAIINNIKEIKELNKKKHYSQRKIAILKLLNKRIEEIEEQQITFKRAFISPVESDDDDVSEEESEEDNIDNDDTDDEADV